MRTEVTINSEMLTWAIERAGFDYHEFINQFPKAHLWMEGKKPTVKQLEDFSKKVHVPFGYLFLQEPPQEKLPIPFFRTGRARAEKVSVNVYDTLMLIQQRQDWLKDYLLNMGADALPFVGKFDSRSAVKKIVADIHQTLELGENWAAVYDTWENALNALTQRVENLGIIIVFNGVVENNTHRKIPVDECRGFVLSDRVAPFMFINNADGKAAQMFTIAHELAHIWTGQSAGFDFRRLQPADDPNEILCDKIAAEFLVPEFALKEIWKQHPDIKYVSRHFKVSEIVIARRALDTKLITKKQFLSFYDEYDQREYVKKDNQNTGGDFYATTRKRLSVTFASHIHNAVKSGKLLYRDAYGLTGLKGDTFQAFFSKLT